MINGNPNAARPDSTGQTATAERGVLVSGASGLVGRALLQRFTQRGQKTTKLVRSSPSDGEVRWDPNGDVLDANSISSDAVVHLAGENIADGRWSKRKMDAIRSSRVRGTRLLSEALACLEAPPSVLVSASAIGYYGDGGAGVLTERSPAGSSFLAEVCQEWEEATAAAQAAGIRVVHLRIGVVLSREGGALQKMLLPFRLGLGGRIGKGDQFMSWILLDDLVSIICKVIDDQRFRGPVNATAPQAVSNAEFTRTLGRVLRRPTIAPMPGFAARAAFGRMAEELLLASLRVYPQELIKLGFEFQQPQLEGALRSALGENP